MTAPHPVLTEVAGLGERVTNVSALLTTAVRSGDVLTARYAAASLTELGDRIETALLAADRAAHALVAGAITNVSR